MLDELTVNKQLGLSDDACVLGYVPALVCADLTPWRTHLHIPHNVLIERTVLGALRSQA